jgi:SAM-dependent methyltransferase
MRKMYYKNKLMIRLSKPFENKRLFTPLQLAILTLKDYRLWPQKLVALDAFCQTGLQWTRIFAAEASYLEMWDIDTEALKYAKKEFPRAKIVCGDSIAAFRERKFGRSDYNFVLLDSPVPFRFPDGSFEHFGFFDDVFRNIASQCIIIFDVVPDIHKMLQRHPASQEFADQWAAARKLFYGTEEGVFVDPGKMIEAYSRKITALGYNVRLLNYNARNAYFGFMTVAVSK